MNISKHSFYVSSKRQFTSDDKNRITFLSLHTASFKKIAVYLILSVLITILFNSIVNGQNTISQQDDFKKTLHDRSVKIVNTLEITDSEKYNTIINLVADQYFNLNKIHDKTKESIAVIRSLQLPDEEKNSRIKKEEEEKTGQLSGLHKVFIKQLQSHLTEDQIGKIKDGMTYRVMRVTYAAYQDMILTLTTEQKEKIYNWLKEARELAMDEGSSDDKHKVFGKYKGRINNYLSTQGYDMKVEEKGWQQRIKEREAAKKNANGK
jgi:hypothetical protein